MNGIEIWNDIVLTTTSLVTVFMLIKAKTLTEVVEELSNQNTRLTSVVEEMSNQSQILAKRLDVEISLADPQRYPSFIIQNLSETSPSTNHLSLINIGQYATHFYVTNIVGDISIDKERGLSYNVILEDYRYVGISINYKTEKLPISFSFTLNYKDGYGALMNQNIIYNKPDISISKMKIVGT